MDGKKVQEVVAKMISEPKAISSVEKVGASFDGSEEYYFYYPDGQYLWSISEDPQGDNFFFFYPSSSDRSNFLRFESVKMDDKGKNDLKKLFQVVRTKLFGFDDVVDQILNRPLF